MTLDSIFCDDMDHGREANKLDENPAADSHRGKRACTECSRKKTKCEGDMNLPTCSLCRAGDANCIYPTTRRPRAHRVSKVPQKRSAQQELNFKVDQLFNLLSSQLSHPHPQPSHHGTGDEQPTPGSNAVENASASNPDSENDGGCSNTVLTEEGPAVQVDCPNPQTASLDAHRMLPETLPYFEFLQFDHLMPYGWPNTDDSPVYGPGSMIEHATNMELESQPHHSVPEPSELRDHTRGTPAESSYQHSFNEASALGDDHLMLDVPHELVQDLINIYFDKVQSFLPLLHRPRFTEKYLRHPEQLDSLSTDSSLVLNGMCALAARFSSSPYLMDLPPMDRGTRFAESAKRIYHSAMHAIVEPTLQYLQGCIMLAFLLYSDGPDSQGWLVIGMCSRLAYDLGLNKIDDTRCHQSHPVSAQEWSVQEELRRAWWCIWELDTFASAIACRPPTIDRTKMEVKLPVSDQQWFEDAPLESNMINPDALKAWQSLRDCPNQDERAWFLLTNFLLLLAHSLGNQLTPDPQSIQDMETAVACYALLLPPQFHLGPGALMFNSQDFAKSNWIIATNIMMQGCRTFVSFLRESAGTDFPQSPKNNLLAPLAGRFHFGVRSLDYHLYAQQVFRALRMWCPEFIPFASPFLGCIILGPAAINLRVAKELSRRNEGKSDLEVELLKLALAHSARFWKIGSILLDIADRMLESA